MAAVGCSLAGSGPQSPLNRNLERSFDEAQVSGELKIGSRRLREFPKIAAKYQLDDTVYADLSKNKLTELPVEVTRFTSLEKLNLYHNVIRSIPDAVVYLQCLTYLDISRNQLSVLPANLCKLPLQVLLVNHNRLVSLPEEISQLTALLELDASCNQLSRLPVQTGDLQQLQVLNLRKNFLVELPKELMFLKLVTLDVSENRIATLPVELRFMVSLVELSVEHNPLTSPPTYLCTRGRIHIFKYLELESIKEDRKRGLLEAGGLTGLADCRRAGLPPRKPSTSSLPQPASQPQPQPQPAPLDPRRKRFTVDNGQAPPPPPPPPPLPPPPPPPPPPLAPSQPASVSGEVPSEVRWPHDARDALNGRHTPSEPPPPQPPPSAASSNGVESKLGDRWPDDDEQEKEERRRAARKILEQQMSTVADERLPGHIQTYREYKEALRQQRSGHVYRRDSSAPPSHTPSPDTPPGPAPGHALQAPLPPPEAATCPPGSTMTGAASRPAPPPVPFSPPPLTRTLSSSGGSGQATRPLQLNVGHCHDVKSAQKEAVLSYVMAKSSPPGGMKAAGPASHPPPYRSPNAPDPSNPPSKGPGPASAPPPYRPAPSDPASAFRSVSRLPRHTAPSNSHGLVNGNTNGNITGNNNAAAAATATTPTTNGNDAGGAPTTPVSAPMSPSKRFTVRRELDKQREEMEQIQQLRQVIESRLKVVLPEDVGAALQDGVVLCHLANHVRPRSVASIHVPSPAVPKLTIARQRRNIDNFVDACRRLGVPEPTQLGQWDDAAAWAPPLLATLRALLDLPPPAPTPSLAAPPLPDPKRLDDDDDRQTRRECLQEEEEFPIGPQFHWEEPLIAPQGPHNEEQESLIGRDLYAEAKEPLIAPQGPHNEEQEEEELKFLIGHELYAEVPLVAPYGPHNEEHESLIGHELRREGKETLIGQQLNGEAKEPRTGYEQAPEELKELLTWPDVIASHLALLAAVSLALLWPLLF